jgi:hypothetical protein
VIQCDAHELQKVKDALFYDANNIGIGLLHEPSGRLHMAPFNDLQGGHDELLARTGLPDLECKGFGIGLDPNGVFEVVNKSHLNGPQGQPGSLLMPLQLFQAIVAALRQAGL